MDIITKCLQPGYELAEGELTQVIDQLIVCLSVTEPELSHIQLVADLGKTEPFREKGDQLIEPLLSLLKRPAVNREVLQQVSDLKCCLECYLGSVGYAGAREPRVLPQT